MGTSGGVHHVDAIILLKDLQVQIYRRLSLGCKSPPVYVHGLCRSVPGSMHCFIERGVQG